MQGETDRPADSISKLYIKETIMNEKFVNFNCAQMAAVAMWMLFSSLKLHCNIMYNGDNCDISVDVFLDEGDDIDIPQGYYYTSKDIKNFDATSKHPAFTSITFNFMY